MPPSDKEAKLLAEIDGWGRHKTLPSAADLPSALPYTAAVVREALRMYPPAAIAAREMADDVTLGDRAVPGGVPLQVRERGGVGGVDGRFGGGCTGGRLPVPNRELPEALPLRFHLHLFCQLRPASPGLHHCHAPLASPVA